MIEARRLCAAPCVGGTREIAVGRHETYQRLSGLIQYALRLVDLATFDLALQRNHYAAEEQCHDQAGNRQFDEAEAPGAASQITA